VRNALIALALTLPLPAAADMYDCLMVEECQGSNACTSSDWEFSIGTMEDGAMLMSSMAGENLYNLIAEDGGYFAYASANLATGVVGLMTLSPDLILDVAELGMYDGAERTSYAGRCAPR